MRLTALLVVIVFLFTVLYLVLEVFSDFNSQLVTLSFWVSFGIVLCVLIVVSLRRKLRRKRQKEAVLTHQEELRHQIDERAAVLASLIQSSFLVQPCSACAEFRMALVELSPKRPIRSLPVPSLREDAGSGTDPAQQTVQDGSERVPEEEGGLRVRFSRCGFPTLLGENDPDVPSKS